METRKRALVGECISRASVEAARAATLAELEVALVACDYERAATIAFAQARAGSPVATDVIGRILPGIELPAITCSLVAIAPARGELLDVLDQRRFPATKDAAELEAIVLYAAWKASAPVPRIFPHLRRLSARSLTAESYALLATIAASIDDANVVAATKPIAPFAKEYAKSVAADDKAMHAGLDAVLQELPSEVEAAAASGFTVRAAAKQPGRNDPCPCGSGNKYKKCCADKPQATPSPVPGLSWDEFLAGDRISGPHIDDLALRDAVRIDITRVEEQPLRALLRKFVVAREWDHAERVRAEATRRGSELGGELTDELATSLLDVGEVSRAHALIATLPDALRSDYELDLAIAEGPASAWRVLVEHARAAVVETGWPPASASSTSGSRPQSAMELAYTLLRAEPALGILVARSCIGTLQLDAPDLMLELVEEARDQMNLPPTDPAWDVLDALTEGQESKGKGKRGKGKGKEPAPGDTALAASTARISELERALASTKAQLADATTRPAAELVRASEQPGGLEAKVRELEGLIREGNAERRELRKQLEAAAAPRERDDSPRARRATLDEPDEGFDETALEPGSRDVALPRFERRFVDALGEVPAQVAAETMRTIGTLAAGDGFAWRSVKQAKDMARQVLMARVGIHHRLIFRVEGDDMSVLDLITREQLDTTLRRLRMNR